MLKHKVSASFQPLMLSHESFRLLSIRVTFSLPEVIRGSFMLEASGYFLFPPPPPSVIVPMEKEGERLNLVYPPWTIHHPQFAMAILLEFPACFFTRDVYTSFSGKFHLFFSFLGQWYDLWKKKKKKRVWRKKATTRLTKKANRKFNLECAYPWGQRGEPEKKAFCFYGWN